MLERMREGSQGIVAKSILVVIILSFALAGVSSYLGTSSVNAVVTVNGEEISQQSVEQAYQNERVRLQQQYGEQFDLIASNPNFAQQVRSQATQTLVTERLIAQAVKDMGLRVGDEQVKNAIRRMPEFQVDGKFNNDRYLSLLRNNSLTPAIFSANFKRDLVRMQLLEALVGSEFVLPFEVEQVNQLQGQKRIAKILTVKSDNFNYAESVSEDEIKTYYANNTAFFQEPEQVSVEYILLDSAQLLPLVQATDKDIQSYYEQHKAEYQRAERRKVAHIFIQGDSVEAQNKAEAILADITAGADFAELAKTQSEDVYSAKSEGELDWFERGVMDPAFDESAFLLTKEAPVSAVVKSEFGFHIIKLIDVQESKTLPLSDVKSQVEIALQQEKVKETYDDLYQRLSEVAFESPDSLEEAAAVTELNVQTTDMFSANSAPSILSDRAILNLVFNENFRSDGLNSEIIELNDSQAIVVRVHEHKMAETKPLVDVSEQITLQLEDQKAAKAAKVFVESLMTQLASGESVESELVAKNIAFSSALTLARYSRDYDSKVIQKLFQLAKPEAGKVTRGYVVTTQGDYAVIELSDVIALDPSVENKEITVQLTTMLDRGVADATYQALVTYLLSEADISYTISE